MELKSNLRAKRGFTLIEVLFSMAIFTIALVGSMGLLQWMTQATGSSTRVTQASTYAQGKLEEFRSVDYSVVSGGNDTSGIFTRTWTSTTADGGKHVVVTVSWAAASNQGNRSVSLRSFYVDD